MRHHRWRKRVAWWGYQRRGIHSAALLHATSRMEADHLRVLGFTAPIAVVPNGVDLAPGAGCATHSPGPTGERTALFLSRLHPKKGLTDLVAAWAAVRPDGWRAVIAGPDESGHGAVVRSAVRSAGLEDRFIFVGPVEGSAKGALYERASLFVLPTRSENFGIVVAEALSYGVPVLTTKGAPWAELEARRCGWWVDVGVDSLVAALKSAVALTDAERAAMGMRGRAWVEREFSWEGVARDMRATYEWVLSGGPAPAFVLLA